MEYTIGEKAEDIKDTNIIKKGVIVNFTMRQVEEHETSLGKLLKELSAKKELEEAKMTNIERNHKFVLKLSEKNLFTAHMYQEAKAIVHVAKLKIKEVEEQVEEYRKEREEIYKQVPELNTK